MSRLWLSILKEMKFWGLLILLFGLSCVTQDRTDSFALREVHDSQIGSASRSKESWVLGGYLPVGEHQTEKSYIVIEGGEIIDVFTKIPKSKEGLFLLDTDHLIFPGLIDLYNHLDYSSLPTWSDYERPLLHRRSWFKSLSYKRFLRKHLDPYQGKELCSLRRWGEVRAIVSGVTTLLGSVKDSDCLGHFGVRNVDTLTDLQYEGNLLVENGIEEEHLTHKFFLEKIVESMRKEGITYGDAYQLALAETGLQQWMELFKGGTQDLRTALQLAVGSPLGVPKGEGKEKGWERARSELNSHLKRNFKMGGSAERKRVISEIEKWVEEYLALAVRGDAEVRDFLLKPGLRLFTEDQRRFVSEVELNWRMGLVHHLRQYESFRPHLLFFPMAEGRKGDAESGVQYFLLQLFELPAKGFVGVHGGALELEDFNEMAEESIPIVWTPASDLALYGETLDVVEAQTMGVQVVMGAGWAHLGVRSLLDQLKVARSYLDRRGVPRGVLSDQHLVEMVTVHAAKVLGRERMLGRLSKGYQADLILVQRRKSSEEDPYSELIQGGQELISLVMRSGEPLYGETSLMERLKSKNLVDHLEGPIASMNRASFMKRCGPFAHRRFGSLQSSGGPGAVVETLWNLNAVRGGSTPLLNCEDPEYMKNLTQWTSLGGAGASGRAKASNSLKSLEELKSFRGRQKE